VAERIPATGRFDDLRLAVFTGRERVAVLSLDFVLVMGILTRFARRHPPHHLNPTISFPVDYGFEVAGATLDLFLVLENNVLKLS
jgi:hypothetical protein